MAARQGEVRKQRTGRVLATAGVACAALTVASGPWGAGPLGVEHAAAAEITPLAQISTTLTRAVPAAAFTDSVGIATHWGYTDTPYGSRYTDLRTLIVNSGVKHVRGDAFRAADLYRFGIRTAASGNIDATGFTTPSALIPTLAPLVTSGAVDAVEGPNEPDLFWARNNWTYRGQGFPAGVVAWQRDLYAAIKGDPRTASATVIGPSLGKNYWSKGGPFAAGSLADAVDWGNFHPYPGGMGLTYPRDYAGVKFYYANSDFPSVAMDRYPVQFTTYQPAFGSKPMSATETGYSTWKYGQSEKMQGRYTPRLFLENFRLGLKRTYVYELLDEFPDAAKGTKERHFGLVRNDLTPKPAYYALKSMMSVLADASGRPTDAATTISIPLLIKAPTAYDARYLHHLALQKSDGSTVIALWHEVSGDDTSGLTATPKTTIRELSQPSMSVSLDLGKRWSGAAVQVVNDQGGLSSLTPTRNGSTVSFGVPDRVAFVTIPAAKTGTGSVDRSAKVSVVAADPDVAAGQTPDQLAGGVGTSAVRRRTVLLGAVG